MVVISHNSSTQENKQHHPDRVDITGTGHDRGNKKSSEKTKDTEQEMPQRKTHLVSEEPARRIFTPSVLHMRR